MKLKSLFFVLCLSLVGHSFAANQHVHPKANGIDYSNNTSVAVMARGYCEIEIQNASSYSVRVAGAFDDGTALAPFNVYSHETPHYISMYYDGDCHNDMRISLTDRHGTFYSSWTATGYSLYVYNAGHGKVKAVARSPQ